MSKTIECVSRHIGEINLTTRKDEQRTVLFEDKGGVGFAMIDEDEAEILLEGIGRPDYWKPGTTGDAVADALKNDPVAAAAAAKLLGGGSAEAGSGDDTDEGEGEGEGDLATVKQVSEQIKACATTAEVDAIVAEDKRIGVLKAAAARRKELAE